MLIWIVLAVVLVPLVALALAVRPVLAGCPGCAAPRWRCSGGPPRREALRETAEALQQRAEAVQRRLDTAPQRLAVIKAKRGVTARAAAGSRDVDGSSPVGQDFTRRARPPPPAGGAAPIRTYDGLRTTPRHRATGASHGCPQAVAHRRSRGRADPALRREAAPRRGPLAGPVAADHQGRDQEPAATTTATSPRRPTRRPATSRCRRTPGSRRRTPVSRSRPRTSRRRRSSRSSTRCTASATTDRRAPRAVAFALRKRGPSTFERAADGSMTLHRARPRAA